jgi:GNAT superfamily N-acetyltransferase
MTWQRLRLATLDDRQALGALIARSVRGLSRRDYSAAQIEAALQETFAVDTQLIRDATYYVATTADGEIVGCGGWSRRATLFGGDTHRARDARELDPQVDAARIRAFFVDPGFARQGIGRALLQRCEDAARSAGFARADLLATLPGVRLYEKSGYAASAPITHALARELTITFVPMAKHL